MRLVELGSRTMTLMNFDDFRVSGFIDILVVESSFNELVETLRGASVTRPFQFSKFVEYHMNSLDFSELVELNFS